jgi:8-oxo-dGTP pyrophosphatase MutT (NUDIX family)
MGYIEDLRSLIGHRKVLVPGVRAVIRNASGEVLLQQRGDFGTWGLPAGAVELDESVMMALQREVWEETALRVMRATPFGMYSNPQNSITYPNGDQVQPISLAFLIDEWAGEPIADGQESLRLAFFDFDHLPHVDQIHPAHHKTILDSRRFLDDGTFIVD